MQEERLEKANKEKEAGNKLFVSGQHYEAKCHYKEAIRLALSLQGHETEKSVYYCNRAACYLHLVSGIIHSSLSLSLSHALWLSLLSNLWLFFLHLKNRGDMTK